MIYFSDQDELNFNTKLEKVHKWYLKNKLATNKHTQVSTDCIKNILLARKVEFNFEKLENSREKSQKAIKFSGENRRYGNASKHMGYTNK
jgi:hypothetical protein